jgi:hypothetical protein
MKYKKKPVVIEAIQWIGKQSFDELYEFADADNNLGVVGMLDGDSDIATINTLEGVMQASPNDYIIKGVKGELYPCKPDIFSITYDEVTEKMSFGEAIHAMRLGGRVARKGWNGKGIFIEIEFPDKNSAMTNPYIYIDSTGLQTDNPHATGSRVPWLASQTDMLSDDWVIL